MFKIEKNIPIYSNGGKGGRKKGALYLTLESLEVGDSFLIPLGKRSHANHLAKLLNIKTVTRLTDDREIIRVWRTK
jgi:hypothetical protein